MVVFQEAHEITVYGFEVDLLCTLALSSFQSVLCNGCSMWDSPCKYRKWFPVDATTFNAFAVIYRLFSSLNVWEAKDLYSIIVEGFLCWPPWNIFPVSARALPW